MNPDVKESFLRTFIRIETWRDGNAMAALGHQMFLALDYTYSPPFNETEIREMQRAMVDAQAPMFAELDPKYMAAIERVRGTTESWSPVSPLIR